MLGICKLPCDHPDSHRRAYRPRVDSRADGVRAARPPLGPTAEPPLAELLDDPILGRLLASDGIPFDRLLALIEEMKIRLAKA